MTTRKREHDVLREEYHSYHRIEHRDRELAEVAFRHFPELPRERVEAVVESHSYLLTSYLQLGSVLSWRRDGRINSAKVAYGSGSATSADLSNLISAIQSANPWRFQKSWGAINKEERSAIARHIKQRWNVRANNTKWLTPIHSAGPEFLKDDQEFWHIAVEVLMRRRNVASSRRRPRNLCRDRIALQLALLWSELSGRPITLPRNEAGSSELVGPLIVFVREAARIFPEITISYNSTTSWARILRPVLSKK